MQAEREKTEERRTDSQGDRAAAGDGGRAHLFVEGGEEGMFREWLSEFVCLKQCVLRAVFCFVEKTRFFWDFFLSGVVLFV